MILRRSNADDLPALMQLWQEVFGDPPAFTGRFYDTFGSDAAIVAEEDDKIVAMIHPLPVALAQNGQYSMGVYIYALATAPAYRGRGIAAALLKEAESTAFPVPPTLAGASAVGLSPIASTTPTFSLLIPGEESLFAYYRSKGYRSEAKILAHEAPDYPTHLRQGLWEEPVFLKPRPFYDLSMRFPQPTPLPVDTALWKASDPAFPLSLTPTLSHFMQ